ncbi:Putative 2,3-dihydroxybiphenyl 1,2-dioxygenase or glyoxalase/bleomycin resistance protein [Mycobacteroides abscessus subsp. abscessus]|nr:Putative 2,3-dihydroxybiphenyl 1,2-dioxygenase or glyoxalase/bleomycin resistance protein [Mycobacteroides abscessus subsp. abscessus]
MLTSLGYLTVATRDMDRWRHFALRVLGFAEGSGPCGSIPNELSADAWNTVLGT